MGTSDTISKGQKTGGRGPDAMTEKSAGAAKKVTDNFSLDGEPLRKLKNYVLAQKLEGAKISVSSIINELIKNKVKELDL